MDKMFFNVYLETCSNNFKHEIILPTGFATFFPDSYISSAS